MFDWTQSLCYQTNIHVNSIVAALDVFFKVREVVVIAELIMTSIPLDHALRDEVRLRRAAESAQSHLPKYKFAHQSLPCNLPCHAVDCATRWCRPHRLRSDTLTLRGQQNVAHHRRINSTVQQSREWYVLYKYMILSIDLPVIQVRRCIVFYRAAWNADSV